MPSPLYLTECVRKVLESVILCFIIAVERLEKVLKSYDFRTFLVRVVIQNFLKKPVISTVFKADE